MSSGFLMEEEKIKISNVCHGILTLKRESGNNGVYTVEFRVDNGLIPENLCRSILIEYLGYKDRLYNKRLYHSTETFGIILQCEVKGCKKIYNLVRTKLSYCR